MGGIGKTTIAEYKFKKLYSEYDVEHVKVLLKDSENDDSVVAGLERLKDKALITIPEDNTISMHDIIQEMAWEIVRQESIVNPGNRS
ncbi:hypothetical protein VNO78_25601 [Psophocarpus tetragonolobus]|uniref:Disease resistance protein Roq1-like winged-helix domain-containing protein n=1 Tax=Psophocarpus tetragonolobus TaxID=3891 RepID=A0AAN9XFY6_PSOTE